MVRIVLIIGFKSCGILGYKRQKLVPQSKLIYSKYISIVYRIEFNFFLKDWI